jgi:hypothetical protein
MQIDDRADVRVRLNILNDNTARIAMIAITTSSSVKVNPLSKRSGSGRALYLMRVIESLVIWISVGTAAARTLASQPANATIASGKMIKRFS